MKRGSEKKEGNTVAIRNQTCNRASRAIYRNQSPRTLPKIFFLSVNLLSSFLYHQDLFICCLIHWSTVFQPILYQFIVLGFLGLLGLSPYTFWARSSNQVLTIGTICGKITRVIVSAAFNHGKFRSIPNRIHRIPTWKSFCQPRAKKGLGGECAYCLVW